MQALDEEKTTFITKDANFCYKVMPFDLKNAGATYQRLMDRIFKSISDEMSRSTLTTWLSNPVA